MRLSLAAVLLVTLLFAGCIRGTPADIKDEGLIFGVRVLKQTITEDPPEFAQPTILITDYSVAFSGDKQTITLDLENRGTDGEFFVTFYRTPVGAHTPLEFAFQSDRFNAPRGWAGTHRWEVVLNGTHHVAQVRVHSLSPGAPDPLSWMIDQQYILSE